MYVKYGSYNVFNDKSSLLTDYEKDYTLSGWWENFYILDLMKTNKVLTKKQIKNTTTKTIDYMYKEYINQLNNGLSPVQFKSGQNHLSWKYKIWTKPTYKIIRAVQKRTKVPLVVVDAYFRTMWEAVRLGKIKYKIIDPLGAKKDKEISKKIVGKDTLDILKDVGSKADTFAKMALVTGGIIGAYLLVGKFKK